MGRTSGTYTAPSNSWNPAVEGTPVDETDWNAVLQDLEDALTESTYTAGLGSTDNRLVRTDGTDGKKTQGTGISVDDSNNISGVGTIDSGAITSTGDIAGTGLSAGTSGVTNTGTIELGHASDTTLARSGAGDVSIEGNQVYRAGGTDVALADGGTGASLSDPGADRIMAWDDSAGGVRFMPVADLTAEAAPAAGDKVLIYGAEGDLRAVDWDDLPGAGIGSGDMVGPASATDNAVVRFNGTGGKTTQNSGVIIDDSDNVRIPGKITHLASQMTDPQGRLTLSTGVPVMTGTVAATGTLRYTPYKGNLLWLYDGSAGWDAVTFSEISIALSGGTASKVHDVFVYNNAGSAALELVTWTNNSTRATALTTQDGRLVKSGDLTRLYLGSVYLDGSKQCTFQFPTISTSPTAGLFGVWNYYNRINHPWAVGEATASWTYATANTWRAMNDNAAFRVSMLHGLVEDPVQIDLSVSHRNSALSNVTHIGIGIDSTSVNSSFGSLGQMPVAATGILAVMAALSTFPSLGWHYYQALEWVSAGTTTFYGDGSAADQFVGMRGTFVG